MVIRVRVLRNPRRVVIAFRRGTASEENEKTVPAHVPRAARHPREGSQQPVLTPAQERN